MSFIISFGRWGGFYFHRGFQTRLCLGWIALTYLPMDYDAMLVGALRQEKWDAIKQLANSLNKTNTGIIKPALLYQLGMIDNDGAPEWQPSTVQPDGSITGMTRPYDDGKDHAEAPF